MRLYDAGVRVQKHVRQVGQTRGTLWMAMETVGRRTMLVARLQEAPGQRAIPPLYDAALAGLASSSWVVTGHERVEAGPTRAQCLVGQTWLVEPAASSDVIAIEQKWLAAVREANALREELAAGAPRTSSPGATPAP